MLIQITGYIPKSDIVYLLLYWGEYLEVMKEPKIGGFNPYDKLC
jgi:hypothetical protein